MVISKATHHKTSGIMVISKATQRRRTITERQRVAFCFGRSRKAGKPYAAEGAAERAKGVWFVDKLTAKQQRFCDEYLIDLNATQAAIRAGYSGKNANNIASENLAKPNIQKYIRDRMAEKETSLIADQNEILEYLTSVLRGESEAGMIVDKNGDMAATPDLPGVKDRLRAAELLGKRYGLFVEKVDLTKRELSDDAKADIDRLLEETKGIVS